MEIENMNEIVPTEQSEKLFTLTKMDINTVDEATKMRFQSWLDTYVNEELGITKEWLEEEIEKMNTPERQEQRRQEVLGSDNNAWVALDGDGNVIGVTTPRIDNGTQRVGSLYVAKEWLGKGVGPALMKKVIEWADPSKDLVLGVASYNERAMAFYRKFGFVEVPDSIELVDDDRIPTVRMIRKGKEQKNEI